jgi:thiosulfate/3-mercaptopyruvate sulfurtransferase
MSMLLTCLILLPAGGGEKEAKTYPRADLLVEATQLDKALTPGKFVILDARPREAYREGHIPFAVWLNVKDWEKGFAASQDPKLWGGRLASVGIQDDSPIIVYGNAKTPDAARIWWILRYWGFKDVRLLNGGWKAWTDGKFPVQTKAKIIDDHGKYRHLKVKAAKDRLATKDQLLSWLKEGGPQIVDARTEGEYCGDTSHAQRGGSIPSARHLEWKDTIDPKTQRFKSPDELKKLFKEVGIDPQRPTVTYCQSGGRAAVMAFVLELMGGKEVRNYYRSWSEWGNDPNTPVARPKKK